MRLTLVTALWYPPNFWLPDSEYNLCIFVDPKDEHIIWNHRDKNKNNTAVIYKTKEDIKTWFEFYPLIDDIDHSINLSKMFLLHDAKVINHFNSDYLFWFDNPILDDYNKLSCLSNDKLLFCEGLFGGKKEQLAELNTLYYHCLKQSFASLSNEPINRNEPINQNEPINRNEPIKSVEQVFTLITNQRPNLISIYDKMRLQLQISSIVCKPLSVHLYVLTYNFPEQFEHLVKSFDDSFLNLPKKYLLNNSTDRNTDPLYDSLCQQYNFTQIKKNNIGICGGRQFIAEHFDQSDADYYIFFEDDMLLHQKQQQTNHCSNGFRKYVDNLYDKSLKIMQKEKYDYLKLNFTEVYGGNEVQWAWYNVPNDVRFKYFPSKTEKPKIGLDPNPPLTQFLHIKKHEDITYIEGDIYYCNWPMWMSKEGSRKVFLEPKYDHPYEQTWMSLVFQKQKENKIKAGLLLLSPINHDRILYYKGEERREN